MLKNFIRLNKKNLKDMLIKPSSFKFSSGIYVDQMYQAWKKDPNSVHESWKIYFTQNQSKFYN